MIDVTKYLKENRELSDYRINEVKNESYEAFFVHKKLETVRATDYTDVSVTIYKDHDGKKGESSFSVYASTTESELKGKIASAAKRAELVFNEPYEIPDGGKAETDAPSNIKEYEPEELAAKVAEAVYAADNYEDGSINAVEIFIYKKKTTVKNSKGVDKSETGYEIMIEAIPTWNEGGESVELYEAYSTSEFDSAAITAEIDGKMKEVRDRKHAVKPEKIGDVKVILKPKEISELISELAADADYATAYSHSNVKNVGDCWQNNPTGDKLTVTARGAVKGSVYSATFDADGTSLKDKKIILGGKVVGRYGSNRFAQYLGEEATGNLRCFEVEKGTLTEEEIKKQPYIECISLSGLQLDLYNDYIGGEIRLAYYFDGEKIVPVTGISMSGRLSNVLETLKATDKIVTERNYRGPNKIMLAGMEIL